MDYPITAILGKRGDGKTVFLTSIGYSFYNEGRKIFSNYHLIGIPYTPITFAELAKLPDYLNDAVVLLDELQVGADAYEIFKRSNKALTTFVTQLRKRKIHLFYTTQVLTLVQKRIRQQTNYIISMQSIGGGWFIASVFDYVWNTSNTLVKKIPFNGAPFFDMYDTNEVIEYGEELT